VLATAAIVTALGVWSAAVVVARTGSSDPQRVVIDEVAGVLFTLAAAPPSWVAVAAGVVLFRVFDQIKPWPAYLAERALPGGWGVVFDDVFAGAWGAAAVAVLARMGGL
jgi:phosphatidylglycerophosphatase A